MQYKIITADDIKLLESRVNKMLQQGWIPVGGIISYSTQEFYKYAGTQKMGKEVLLKFAQPLTLEKMQLPVDQERILAEIKEQWPDTVYPMLQRFQNGGHLLIASSPESLLLEISDLKGKTVPWNGELAFDFGNTDYSIYLNGINRDLLKYFAEFGWTVEWADDEVILFQPIQYDKNN